MALANSSHRTDRSERRSRHSLLAEEEIIGHNIELIVLSVVLVIRYWPKKKS